MLVTPQTCSLFCRSPSGGRQNAGACAVDALDISLSGADLMNAFTRRVAHQFQKAISHAISLSEHEYLPLAVAGEAGAAAASRATDPAYPSAATSERSFTDGLSRWKPSNRHLVENSTSSTPSVRVNTSEDTCLLMNSRSAGSSTRAT